MIGSFFPFFTRFYTSQVVSRISSINSRNFHIAFGRSDVNEAKKSVLI